ncbi:hypothetical protein TOI97_00685 [Denitrificimonas sp. JX-1]|uniref:PEP-CTERM protein-sorting domain-containing protein n=1 Tax=Denitrificimonas halotolerans TaxID=3098930 RepID=A0ABU5GNN7_9GAMM|nr:hypothetical protein [Denitrificimonas sp. JX-1]MDY7218102.1 hypothetical protein [Denitrificimonas sp. JX-1]
MNNPLNVMTLLITLGIFCLAFGYNWRERSWGIALLMFGMLCMFSSIVYRISLAIY